MTYEQIVDDISNHVQTSGYDYPSWYIGITSNIKDRLHGDHSVPEKNHWFMARPADTNDIARRVEQHFLSAGMDGGPGGGDETSNIVYAYVKTSITNP